LRPLHARMFFVIADVLLFFVIESVFALLFSQLHQTNVVGLGEFRCLDYRIDDLANIWKANGVSPVARVRSRSYSVFKAKMTSPSDSEKTWSGSYEIG
jgi:hypothetical protein